MAGLLDLATGGENDPVRHLLIEQFPRCQMAPAANHRDRSLGSRLTCSPTRSLLTFRNFLNSCNFKCSVAAHPRSQKPRLWFNIPPFELKSAIRFQHFGFSNRTASDPF